MLKKNLLLLSLFICLSASTFAAQQPCGADSALENFQSAAQKLISKAPALTREIDNCFNTTERPEYTQQAKKILQDLSREFKVGLSLLTSARDSLRAGHDEAYKKTVAESVGKMHEVSRPLFENAGNLKNYGFTTSDREVNGRAVYPNCNSEKNNQPERLWASFYADAQAAKRALQEIQSSVNCLE